MILKSAVQHYVLVSFLIVNGIAAAEETRQPPVNNSYSGFPIGSWIEEEGNSRIPNGQKQQYHIKLLLSQLCPDGSYTLESFRKKEEQWLRNDYETGSGTGAVVDLSGWQAIPNPVDIVFENGRVNRHVQKQDWKEKVQSDEDLKIGERTFHCRVREWTQGNGQDQLALKFWFADGISIPGHMELFGDNAVTLYTAGNNLRIEWSAKGQKIISTALGIDEPYEVAGQTTKCTRWESEAAGMVQHYWLSNDVPGRKIKTQRLDKQTGEIVGEDRVLNFHIQKQPQTTQHGMAHPSEWDGFPVGAWVEYREVTIDNDGKSTTEMVRDKLLGFNDDGYPILGQTHNDELHRGIESQKLLVSYPVIDECGYKVVKDAAKELKVNGKPLQVNEKFYECQDQWNRPWRAIVNTSSVVGIPTRSFDYSSSHFFLGKDVVYASAMMTGEVIVRAIVNLNDELKIGSRRIHCTKEIEVKGRERTEEEAYFWFSDEIPGHVVRKVEGSGKEEEVKFEVIDFSKDGH